MTAALVDCEDHQPNGSRAVLENVLRTGSPVGTHDPVGWPTFKDWPAPDSLTHEGTYYKWMERAWRGGQRLFVNLLVENGQLCTAYPLKRNSCDEMDSIRLQARRMHQFERYIDAQSGRAGQGLVPHRHRPVPGPPGDQPGQARGSDGHRDQRAVRLLASNGPAAECDEADHRRASCDEVYAIGVRQMELVNKFDNALSGRRR